MNTIFTHIHIKGFKYWIAALLFAISTVPTFLPAEVANAQDAPDVSACDEAFYASNDVLFYNPCASTCSAAAGGSATVETLRGQNNGEKIFNYWIDAGLTAQQSAGITGSMYHEGGFSPFRQEMTESWPNGGWGIAQFTAAQRSAAITFVINEIGQETFNQYYKDQYGGNVMPSNGYIPSGIPVDVNDKFLLAELNYLNDHIKSLKPNNIRRDAYKADFNQSVDALITLYDYLKTVVQSGDAATAWTYLYEYPGDIKKTASERAVEAAGILELYSKGTSSSCGGNLKAGGMDLEEAKKFMESYKSSPDSVKFVGGAAQDCPGGPLSNCTSFSMYFVNKYTSLQGMGAGTSSGNGSTVAANIISRNPTVDNGHSPRPYAVFSTSVGSEMCGDVKCGHTGVILGVDTDRKKVIVGEASCGGDADRDTAREYELSDFDSNNYTYVYTDGVLKGDVK
jgi:hypothetical protein